MMMHDDDITNKILLEHIQQFEHFARGKFEKIESDIKELKEWNICHTRRFDMIDVALTNIDKRLDFIEGESLPLRMKKVEKAVF